MANRYVPYSATPNTDVDAGGGNLNTLFPTTTYDGSSSVGWTVSAGGSNRAASISSGLFNVSISPGELGAATWFVTADHPRIYRDLTSTLTTNTEDFSAVARLAIHSTGGRAAIAFGDATDTSGIFASIASNGLVSMTGTWGNGADVSSGASALPLDGTGWVRLWVRGGHVVVGYGTGSSVTPPNRWSTMPYTGSSRHRGVMSRLTLYAWDATGVGATVAWDDIEVRDGR